MLLQAPHHSTTSASIHTGLSSGRRVHDRCIAIEEMTPGEYKNEDNHLTINSRYRDLLLVTQTRHAELSAEQAKTASTRL